MKIIPFLFGAIMLKNFSDAYRDNINGPEQKVMVVIASFLSGMFFGEYLLLYRQKKLLL